MDDNVFACVSTALVELSPGPFLVFVGNLKTLQPVLGVGTLPQSLRAAIEAGSFRNIEHLRHENSRSTDQRLLTFLDAMRKTQPSRSELETFFSDRILSRCHGVTTSELMRKENGIQKQITIFSVGLRGPPLASLGKFVKKRAVKFVGEKRPKSNDFGRVKPRFRRKSLFTLVREPRPGLFCCFSAVLHVLIASGASLSLFSGLFLGFFWPRLRASPLTFSEVKNIQLIDSWRYLNLRVTKLRFGCHRHAYMLPHANAACAYNLEP